MKDQPKFRISILHMMIGIVFISLLVRFFPIEAALFTFAVVSFWLIPAGFLIGFVSIAFGSVEDGQVKMKGNLLPTISMFLLALGIGNMGILLCVVITLLAFGIRV